jgi:ParB-like chromosome segregation protein Spo0J
MLYSHHPEPPQVTKQAKSWRDVIKVHPAANLFPMMSADELKALGKDIRQKGLTSPIAITANRYVGSDWAYQLLDGRNRLDAMELAGIEFDLVLKDGKCIIESELDCARDGGFFPPAIVVNNDLYAYVISANVHRRHLTTQQKLDLLDKVMKAHPNLSSRRIAKLAGVSPTTAAKSRRKLQANGDVSTVDTSIDTKGRKQPTRKLPIPKKPALALASELVKFCDDYCARVRDWREARPDGQHLPTLIHALKQVSSQLQTLAQEIESHTPGTALAEARRAKRNQQPRLTGGSI